MKAFVLATSFFLLSVTVGAAENSYRYVRLPLRLLTPEFVTETQFIRDHKPDDAYAFGYLKRDRKLLPSVESDLVELDAREWAHADHDAKTLRALPPAYRFTAGTYEDYHTYETLTRELKTLAQTYPQLATLASAGKSVEGRDLWYLKITASSIPSAGKPKLLYVSSMHGDEVTGKEMLIYLTRDLLTKYGTDSRLTRLVNYAEIYVMPSMNPDGTQRQQRFNANDVDLNRDFPGLGDPMFSEEGRAPETKALMELHRNNNFLLAMNLHGGSLVVNIPWDSQANTSDKFGDDAVMRQLARHYADKNGPMAANTGGSFDRGVTYGYEWYQVLGGMQDWADYFRGYLHATLEISETKWPDASELPQFWKDNRESILGYLEGGLTGIHLTVTDAGGKLLPCDVDTDTAHRTLPYEGYVHRTTTTGPQLVTVRSPGYAPQSFTVEAKQFDGTYRRVVMGK